MQTLLSIFRATNGIVTRSLADLTDDVARRRSRGQEGPSITWTIGHLLDFRHRVMALLGDARPSPWRSSFGALAATDGADYPTLEPMRSRWKKTHEALEHVFATTAHGTLDQTTGNAGVHGETSVRDKIAFLAWHEGYHVGVIGAARIAAGLPGPAELVPSASTPASSVAR